MSHPQIDAEDAERINEIVLSIVARDRSRMAGIAAVEIPEEDYFWPYLDRMDVTLVAPPADHLAGTEVRGDPGTDDWIGVDLPLWSEEEGRSDYTLRLHIDLTSSPHPILIRNLGLPQR
jgi:hypothetical protein